MTARADTISVSAPSFAAATAALAAASDILAQGRASEADARDIAVALSAVARLYAAKVEREGAIFPPVERDALTATETVTLVSELLRMADLNVFDLAMWFRRAR